jgi:urea-proton symporter
MTSIGILYFILAYFTLFTMISYRYSSGYDQSKSGFLVANRNAGFWESSLAAGASWVLGLALFSSSEFGYNLGWVGLCWFIIPQTMSLFVFAWFSCICNRCIPNGYTISGFMKETYGTGVSIIYQITLCLISLGFIALTFTALNKFLIFAQIDNVTFISGMIILGTLAYALKGGLKTNLITGSIQMIVMLIFCVILLSLALSGDGILYLLKGINGKGNIIDLFDSKLVSSFGMVVALTSITGIVGNQSYYQKSFGQQTNNKSWLSFLLGGIFFSIVPITFGILGMIAYGSGLEIKDASIAHLLWMQSNMGILSIAAFGILVLTASANALDTAGNAFGAIIANEYIEEKNAVFISRICIVAIATIGWLISIFNFPMLYIFLTYAVLRICLFFITILAVTSTLLNRTGILFSILTLAPASIYLNLNNMKLEAVLIGFFATPILGMAISKLSIR